MMTFNRVCSPCLFLCLAVLASGANAQNTATPASGGYSSDTTGFATAGDFSGSYLFGNDGGTYFLFDKMVGNGPGYSAGYSRLGLRIKLHDAGDSHLWGSAYALITDENRVGVNLGGGYRWLFDSNILSLHGWWDSYETDNGFRYDQVTAGIELLHEELDMRVNGYLPVGETENFVGVTNPGTVSTFTSRGIGFFGQGLDEQALKGVDAEVGTAIFGVNWARVYGGGYWYEGKNTSFGGARGRIEAAISPDLSLNFIAQNDTEFDTNYQLSVEYRFSGGLSPGFFTPFHGESRKYNPVKRQWPIATQVVEIDTIVPMLNPKTGGIMTAAFVDNRNPGAGDGSYENPYSELPGSVDADKIFVFAGNGETNGNITLMPNQQLLGEGKLYEFIDPIRGVVTAPDAFSSTGPRPILRAANPAENVITLSDWNRVANFGILGPAQAAIGGTNIRDFEIDMVSAANVTDGIRIVNASGTGIIRNSGFAVSDEGIFVSNINGGPLNLLIEGGSMSPTPNALDGITSLGGNDGVHVRANGADINLVMRDVLVHNAADRGITLDAANGARLTADIEDTSSRNPGGGAGDGFNLNAVQGASMAVLMQNVGARGNGDLFEVDVRNSDFVGTVLTSDFSDSVTGSGVRMHLEDATGRLSFENLAAHRNAVNGIEAHATGDDTNFLLSVVDSKLLANMGSGMDIDIMGGADFRHFVDPTFVTMSGGSGLEYSVQGAGSVYIADIISTDFSESTLHAVNGYVADGAYANVDLLNTPGILAGLNGYNLVVEQNAEFRGTVDTAQFTGAADAAVNLEARNNSLLHLTMTDILGQTNGNAGLQYLAESGSDLFLAVTNGDFNTNPDSNIVGTSRGAGSRASVYLTNVTADGGGANGLVVLNAEDGGVLNQHWNGGSISQGDADGVVARVDGPGSQIRMDYTGVSIGTNMGDGIDAALTNGGAGSVLDITLLNSAVTQNDLNGLDLSISGPGARSQVIINNTPMGGNFGGDGFEFDVMNGAGLVASAFGPATHFAQNGERAWDGSVDGAGSFANLNFNGTDAVASGLQGGLFEVTGGGQLNLTLANLSISQNALDGLLTTVDGPDSIARINMDQVLMQRNGLSLTGDGFEALATNSGQIVASLSNMDVIENREDAFLFDASSNASIQVRMDNVRGDNNGRHGLEYHVSGGGQFDGLVNTSSFTGNGTVFVGNGVYGTATDAGSISTTTFNQVLADNNNRMGFEFDASNGATLLANIRSGGLFGNSSGSGNGINGVRFNATDPGTMGFLLMSGQNVFDNNVAGDGVNVDAVNVDMMVTQVSGTINNNGADGVNILYNNVNTGSIAVMGEGQGTVTGNAGDGIDIRVHNSNLIAKTINGITVPSLLIDGLTIEDNGGENLVLNVTNSDIEDGQISNNIINGGTDAINVHLGAGDSDLTIVGNTIADAAQYGIVVTTDAGTHNVKILENLVTSSGDTNIFTDIYGTSETGLMINDNTVIGGGLGTPTFTVGTNFTGMTLTDAFNLGTASIPPDTMGAVGPDHIVEFVNNGVTIFNKDGSVAVPSISLDDFWLAAGLPDVGDGTFDPRIIFDPTVDRWFVAAIDSVAAGANSIYVGVSNTADPTQGFTGLRFVGDSVDDARFNDFDTFGIDADGVYLATNNFGGPNGFDVSIYSIPKSDLLAGIPTVANLSRFEGLDPAMFGQSIQPAVDFGPSDGLAQFVGTLFPGGSSVQRVDVIGADTPTATIGAPSTVATPFYQIGPGGRQPNPFLLPLEPPTPRFSGNVIEVGDSLWAVQDVQGTTGTNSAVRWYEIDANTNTVLQTGLIEDPNLDFIASSININAAGAVMIGFTGTGPGQFASSMAAFGTTDAGGVTSFQTPTVLQAGVANYQLVDGANRNRWGDYSATVIDPSNPNTFWTFQELAVGPNDFGVQITEIQFSQAVLGGTANDGIHVDVRETARLTDSMINNNTARDHGDDGIEVLVTDTATVDNLTIDGNSTIDNGGEGIRFETASPNIVGGLSVSGNADVSGNSGNGIEVILSDLNPAMVPDVNVDGNTVTDNLGGGILVSATNSNLGDVSAIANIVQRNTGGSGISIDIDNQTAGVISTNSIDVSLNTVSENAGDAINVNLNDISNVQTFDMHMSNLIMNMGGGLSLTANNSPIGMIRTSMNTIVGNTDGDGILMDLTNSGTQLLSITDSNIEGNTGDGINLLLDGSPVDSLVIADNNAGMASAAGTLRFDFTNLIWTTFQDNNSDPGFNIAQTMIDINPVGQGWRPDLTPATAGVFQPQGGTDVTVGLSMVNGNVIIPGTDPIQTTGGVPLPDGGVPIGSQVLTLDFNDFNPGERLEYNLAHTLLGDDTLQTGTTLAGSIATAVLEDGRTASGMIGNPGMTINQFFPGTTGGISDNLGNGVRVTATNGSNIGALTVDGNVLNSNGEHGVELIVQDSTLPAMSSTVSNNTITNHADGDGFRLINPDTNGTDFTLNFVDNDIANNGASSNGVGINIEVNGDSGGITSTMTGNNVSGNGSIGISLVSSEDANMNLTIGDSTAAANVLENNTDAGIAIKTKDMSTADVIVENTSVTGTADGPNAAFNGDGLAVHSSGSSIVRTLTIGDDMLDNTSFSSNAGNGIDLQVSETARNPNVLIQNVVANNNGTHGIGLTRTDFGTFSEDLDSDGVIDPGEDVNNDGLLGNAVITMTTANDNGGNGLDVAISGGQLPVQQVDVMLNQNSFSNNTIGMNFTVNNDAILLVNAANNVIDNNSSHGIQVTTNQNSAFGNVLPSMGDPNSPLAIPSTFSSNVITNNGGNGLNFVANDSSVQAIVVDDAGAVNPSTGTARTVIDGNAGNQVQITGNDDSQQNVQLTAVNITNVNGVATGDGVNIDANDDSTVTVSINGGVTGPAIIGASIAHVSVPGLGGPGAGVADGIAADVSGQAILNLDVTDVSLFNNTGDAINIRNSGPGSATTGVSQRQTIQATFDGIDARLNGDQGFDVVLDGNIGGRAAQLDTDAPVLIDIMNSNFSSNTNEGIFFRADPGFTHGVNPLYSDMIVTFNVLNSMIQSNGTTSITDGLVMEIGTNAYVLSTVSGNMFGANGADDFHTNSFDSGANNNAAALDLAFQNNSGDHIRPSTAGATNGTPFFILDNSLTVEANNNFQTFGVPQMEVFGPDGFQTNGYLLRVISNHGDPTFP